MVVRTYVLTVLLLVACSTAAVAQEVQIALDEDASVFVLSPDLRDVAGVLSEVEGFQQATLYRVAPSEYELVIQYRDGNQTLRERRTLTEAAVDASRARVSAGLQSANMQMALNQDGRYGLLASATILSLAEGALIGDAMGLDEDGVGTMTLLGGATGFFVPLLVTRNAAVSEPEADMLFYGGVQGYIHGLNLYYLFGGDDGDIDESDERALTGLMATLGLTESIAGYLLARRNNWAEGHGEMVSFNGLSGTGLGAAAAILAGGEDASARLVNGFSIAGSLTGAYIGHRMGRSGRYTQGDARIYLLSGITVANVVGSVAAAANVDDGRTASGLVATAGTAGLLLGRTLVRNRRFNKVEANITILGSVAGSLFGAGIGVVSDASGDAIGVLQAAGAFAGGGLTYAVFSGSALRREARHTSGIDVSITPGLRAFRVPGPDARGGSRQIRPELRIRATF